jgi:hypothetical protein
MAETNQAGEFIAGLICFQIAHPRMQGENGVQCQRL